MCNLGSEYYLFLCFAHICTSVYMWIVFDCINWRQRNVWRQISPWRQQSIASYRVVSNRILPYCIMPRPPAEVWILVVLQLKSLSFSWQLIHFGHETLPLPPGWTWPLAPFQLHFLLLLQISMSTVFGHWPWSLVSFLILPLMMTAHLGNASVLCRTLFYPALEGTTFNHILCFFFHFASSSR